MLEPLARGAPVTARFHIGDALDVLQRLEASSADALVTDPPAGIGFMGKDWDGDKGGRAEWVAWLTGIAKECFRVLKPGAHGLVWALPRTSHWTATALEDAGFEVRDVVMHLFGTGFPKSLDVSKAIDKAAGAEREVLVERTLNNNRFAVSGSGAEQEHHRKREGNANITAPATPLAQQWEGFGTALKPAAEHWILVRKPLVGITVAANVAQHGTGALNIDGCRIAGQVPRTVQGQSSRAGEVYGADQRDQRVFEPNAAGRWPANVTLDEEAAAALDAQSGVSTSKASMRGVGLTGAAAKVYGKGRPDFESLRGHNDSGGASRFFYVAKSGRWPANVTLDEEAAAALDAQSGTLKSHDGADRGGFREDKSKPVTDMLSGTRKTLPPGRGDSGGASRFFYVAKPSKRERGEGNSHPTVKSIALMRWLVRLVTPPGGTVLDPFAGSGTTGLACMAEGLNFVGIEREREYVEIAKKRLAAAGGGA